MVNEMCVDIQENLVACIEMIDSFCNSETQLASMKEQREKILADLHIDVYYKFGELCHFQELYEESIPYFSKVTELCATVGKGSRANMKTSATAFFEVGSSYSQLKKSQDATKNYKLALEILKKLICLEYNQIGKNYDSNTVSNEIILQPSIFDNEELKDLKGFFAEILARIDDTVVEEQISKQLEQMKAQETEQQVKVDENFGKFQPNAAEFKPIVAKSKITQKRTYNEMQASNPAPEEAE